MRWSSALRLVALVAASALFFMLVGPAVGGIIFVPKEGLLASLMIAYYGGWIPALLTGTLNAIAIATGIVRLRSVGGRLLHALVGGLCGFLTTVLFLDFFAGWELTRQTSGWYEFWYIFNRDHVPFSIAGLLAGAVCSFIFNPWVQRRYTT